MTFSAGPPTAPKTARKKPLSCGVTQKSGTDRLSSNLRSAYHPLLAGRAIAHLVIECKGFVRIEKGFSFGGKFRHRRAKDIADGSADATQLTVHFVNAINPYCYSTLWCGRVISARLLRSPVSSDCAFGLVGRSVSSRYTFPKMGLARRYLSIPSYHLTKACASKFYQKQHSWDSLTAPKTAHESRPMGRR